MSADKESSWRGLETIEAREAVLLAKYAMHSADSAGRKFPEPTQSYRGPFQRDRDRVIHTAAYRRLSHKTQVFTGEMGDYHRTRLTHTLEVSSIARTIGRALRVNEDLIEALALMHDIGHPPFGHAGEDALNELVHGEGGFSHNQQALRIVEELEIRYQGFPGLNLSQEILESQRARVEKQTAARRPLLEAQIVDAADSAAYDSHDPDDALQLGLLNMQQLREVPLWRHAAERVSSRSADIEAFALRRAIVHELIDWQVRDLLDVASRRLAENDFSSPSQIRDAPTVITPSQEMAEQKAELEAFLFERVYRHPDVLKVRSTSQANLREMFEKFLAHEDLLPTGYRERIAVAGLRCTVCDYIAGMTDRFAQREYERVCGPEMPPRGGTSQGLEIQ